MSDESTTTSSTTVVPPFAMVATFKPLSLSSAQSTRGGRYQQDVARVAHGAATTHPRYRAGQPLFADDRPLYARIAYFHTYPRLHGDTDNIVKPLLDALGGVVYPDDRLIKRCLVDAVTFSTFDDLELSLVGAPDRAAENLLSVLTGKYSDVLYIEVGLLTSQRLELGRMP